MVTPRRERQTDAGTKRDSDRDAGAATKCHSECRTRTSPQGNPGRPIPAAVLRTLLL